MRVRSYIKNVALGKEEPHSRKIPAQVWREASAYGGGGERPGTMRLEEERSEI